MTLSRTLFCIGCASIVFFLITGLLTYTRTFPPSYTLQCKVRATQEGQPVVDFKFTGPAGVLFFERAFETKAPEYEHWKKICK